MELQLCFITSQIQWREPLDILISPTIENGILKESVIRIGKIATLEKLLVKELLGKLSLDEIKQVDSKLKELLMLE